MNTTLTLCLAVCAGMLLVGCKTTSPTGPDPKENGRPTPIGTPIGAPSTKTIDASGGTLLSPDGQLELIVPPNALSAATAISIQPVTNEAPQGAGVGYSITPHGLTFSQPVTLRFHCGDSDRAGTDIKALRIATQKNDRIWYSFNTVTSDSAAGTVSVTTSHFSLFAMYQSLRVIPYHSEIKVKETELLAVVFVERANVDNDPLDDAFPLGYYVIYSVPSQITWRINGGLMGNQDDGFVVPDNNTSTAIYTAPSTIRRMSSNPVAVTAVVDIPGSAKFELTSSITVIGAEPSVSGSISLSITVDGSRTYSHGGVMETKTELGSGNLVYTLLDGKLEDVGGGSSGVNWDSAGFHGSSSWTSEHITSYNYICDPVKDRQVTGAAVMRAPDSSYTISVGPSTSITAATTVSTREFSGYCNARPPETSTYQSPIPFSQYFLPYVAGGGAKMSGKILPAEPDRLHGVYHGTDQYTVFSYDTTVINLPIEYTIVWDLMLTR
jgi:hypothetical protein